MTDDLTIGMLYALAAGIYIGNIPVSWLPMSLVGTAILLVGLGLDMWQRYRGGSA